MCRGQETEVFGIYERFVFFSLEKVTAGSGMWQATIKSWEIWGKSVENSNSWFVIAQGLGAINETGGLFKTKGGKYFQKAWSFTLEFIAMGCCDCKNSNSISDSLWVVQLANPWSGCETPRATHCH